MGFEYDRAALPRIDDDFEPAIPPEKRLLAAIIRRSFHDLTLSSRLRRESSAWIFARKAAHHFSFNWCCSELNWDAERIRHALEALTADQLRENLDYIPRPRVEAGKKAA